MVMSFFLVEKAGVNLWPLECHRPRTKNTVIHNEKKCRDFKGLAGVSVSKTDTPAITFEFHSGTKLK